MKFLVHPGLLWVKAEATTVEEDRSFEVLDTSEAANSPLDGHDLTVHPLGNGIGNLDAYATQMASANAGCVPFELGGDSQRAYREFVVDLVAIPGLIGILSANRYSIRIQGGRHFEVSQIATLVATVVRGHFYPDQEPRYTVLGISGEVVAQA